MPHANLLSNWQSLSSDINCFRNCAHEAHTRTYTAMVHSHCTGPGNDGFLYYAMYCTLYSGAGTGNHCFLLYPSQSQSRSRSRAMCMSHYSGNNFVNRVQYLGLNHSIQGHEQSQYSVLSKTVDFPLLRVDHTILVIHKKHSTLTITNLQKDCLWLQNRQKLSFATLSHYRNRIHEKPFTL